MVQTKREKEAKNFREEADAPREPGKPNRLSPGMYLYFGTLYCHRIQTKQAGQLKNTRPIEEFREEPYFNPGEGLLLRGPGSGKRPEEPKTATGSPAKEMDRINPPGRFPVCGVRCTRYLVLIPWF